MSLPICFVYYSYAISYSMLPTFAKKYEFEFSETWCQIRILRTDVLFCCYSDKLLLNLNGISFLILIKICKKILYICNVVFFVLLLFSCVINNRSSSPQGRYDK